MNGKHIMANAKKEVKLVSKEVQKIIESFNTVSAKIRYLHSLSWSQGDIARKLNKRPQHINNVLRTAVSKPIESIPSISK